MRTLKIAFCLALIVNVWASILVTADAQTPPQGRTSASCLPGWPWTNFKWGVPPTDGTITPGYDLWAAWVCNTPTGYITEVWLINKAATVGAIVDWMAGNLTKSQADADCALHCVAPTPTEAIFINKLIADNAPVAVVSFNTNRSTRTVYQKNADGTLNPTSIAGMSVAVGAKCNPADRIPNSPYYSVSGDVNASSPTKDTLAGAYYTICDIGLPMGSN